MSTAILEVSDDNGYLGSAYVNAGDVMFRTSQVTQKIHFANLSNINLSLSDNTVDVHGVLSVNGVAVDTTAAATAVYSSNLSVLVGNLASSTSNDLYPSSTFGSNTSVTASNSANTAQITADYASNLSAFGRDTAIFGCNVSVYASNNTGAIGVQGQTLNLFKLVIGVSP